MPFTALKRLTANSPLFSRDGCAPPNAVYGIETAPSIHAHKELLQGCAPPNAVYGIETTGLPCTCNTTESVVVRRLMPFTALKL